jgi:chromosome segregation ATPase
MSSPSENVEVNQKPRRRVLPVISFLVAIAALAVGGYSLKRADDEVKQLRRSMSSLDSDVSILESDVSILESDLLRLKRSVLSLESDVSTLESDLPKLKRSVSAVESDLRASEYKVSTHDTYFNNIDREFNALQSCVNAFIDAWATNGRAYYC